MKPSLVLLLAALCLSVMRCSQGPDVAGHTGGTSDQGNALVSGYVFNADHSPAAYAKVYLRSANYSFSADTAAGTVVRNTLFRDSAGTNSSGAFSFDSIAPGTYIAEAADQGSNGAINSAIEINSTTQTKLLDTLVLKPTGSIQGTVTLPGSGNPATMAIFPSGLDRYVIPDSLGRFTFPGLPEGVYDFRLLPLSDSLMTRDTLQIAVTSGLSTLLDPIRMTLSGELFTKKISESIVLDGVLSEPAWGLADTVAFSNAAQSANQVKVYTLWNDSNLYLAFEVADTQLLATDAELWWDDGAEFFFDVNHDATSALDADDLHFIVNIHGVISSENDTGSVQAPIHSSISITPAGYIMEIAIPWSTLKASPFTGKTIGLLLGNNDMRSDGSRQFDWLGIIDNLVGIESYAYMRPNLWGDLILTGN